MHDSDNVNIVWRLMRDERGMETIEWAVLGGLIVVGALAVITGLGANIKTLIENLSQATAP